MRVHYPVHRGWLRRQAGVRRAVDGVTFDIRRGEVLALVGESGCGKTSLGRAMLRLDVPVRGRVTIDGAEVTALRARALRRFRPRMQMVFQDAAGSLNPRMTVGALVGEPLRVHAVANRKEREGRVLAALREVGLDGDAARRYPHEFSSGQRQRVGIARALVLRPDFVVADEPVSALDVSVQSQIVGLLKELQTRHRLTLMVIAHDLRVVQALADRVAVMYLGRLMELAERHVLFESPQHPYTQALLSAVPIPDPVAEAKRRPVQLAGEAPDSIHPPTGCVFHTRCHLAVESCRRIVPEWRQIAPGHHVACHLVN